MKLSTLLDGVTVTKIFHTVYGKMVTTHDAEIDEIRIDSRAVRPGDLFVAVRGQAADGHRFASQAMHNGASVIVLERDDAVSDPECMHAGVVKVVVPNSRVALAQMAATVAGHPARTMRMVGVTGTNGKTTTTQLISSVLQAGGERAATIGTTGIRYGSVFEPSTHTTPDATDLQRLLAAMKKDGITAVSMEVSSHALEQARVEGIPFASAVFTNLTQDHLDYHGTMDAYLESKKKLFDGLLASSYAVVNADDPWVDRITKDTRAHVLTYGESSDAAVKLCAAEMSVNGSKLDIQYEGSTVSVSTPLIGRFNVSNVLAAFATGIALGIRVPAIELGIASLANVKGRFERIPSAKGWTAIVDYAHTPDALQKCLEAVRHMMGGRGRIIAVFGAGGDRDKGKRPIMGEVAARLSDEVIVTSDNPRSEDPEAIIDEIMNGIMTSERIHREADRRRAIQLAASMAVAGDIILLAGKGHEEVQVIGTDKQHFSDQEEIAALA